MKKEYLYAAVSIFFWSTVATVTKLLLGSFSQFQVLWISALFAGLALLLINCITGNIRKLKAYRLKDYLILSLIGLPGTFLYYVFYYSGAAMMPASQAFIVNYLWPMMSIVFGCLILKDKANLRTVLAVVTSFFGVGIVVCSDLAAKFDTTTLLGTLLCVLGAVSYGVFTALGKKFGYDKPLSMMIAYFTTFVLTTFINLARGHLFLPNLLQSAGFAWNGVLTMAVASTAWVMALDQGKTEKISNLAYITPFLSLVWTCLVLKEEFKLTNLIGLAMIVLGILLQFKKEKKA